MNAFVVMPFDKGFNDTYNLGIKDAAKAVSIKAERLDEQIFATDMLQKIYSEIDKADLIIADMSNRNPNVFYEVGYCDAKKKMVILITNNVNDIPFDFKHRPHIIYDDVTQLKSELIKKLTWAKEEIEKQSIEPLYSEINVISSSLERTEYRDTAKVRARLEITNRTDSIVNNISSIMLHMGKDWTVIYNGDDCTQTESKIKPYKERHIIHPSFNSIPANDYLPIEIEMRRTLYSSWDTNTVKKDSYKLEGNIKVVINTDKNKYISEILVKNEVEFEDIPF